MKIKFWFRGNFLGPVVIVLGQPVFPFSSEVSEEDWGHEHPHTRNISAAPQPPRRMKQCTQYFVDSYNDPNTGCPDCLCLKWETRDEDWRKERPVGEVIANPKG